MMSLIGRNCGSILVPLAEDSLLKITEPNGDVTSWTIYCGLRVSGPYALFSCVVHVSAETAVSVTQNTNIFKYRDNHLMK